MAAALSAIPGRRLLTEPPKRPLRILNELIALEKGRNIGIIAETIVNSEAGGILCDYVDAKIGPKPQRDRVLSAMLDLDGLVARSPFDRSLMVGLLDKLLGDISVTAEADQGIRERTVSVRKILCEYVSTRNRTPSGIDLYTE